MKVMKKKMLSLILVVAMVLGMMPNTAMTAKAAETECPVTENVIDITDKAVATWNRYTNKVTNISISGGNVKSATEDGTTINVLMEGTTELNAELTVDFGKSVGMGSITQSSNKVQLDEGEAVFNVTVNSSYAGNIMKGSVEYVINFTTEEAGTAEIESIDISRKDGKNNYSVNETKTLELTATVNPADAKSRKVIWSSLDESIATVDEKGVVTGIKAGKVKIRATSDVDAEKYGEIEIEVLPVPDNLLLLDIVTSNGSIDSVEFLDANGDFLEVVQKPTIEGTAIKVFLSKNVADNAKVKAKFTLTQNGEGLPFLTTKTGTSGTSGNKAVNNKFTEKETTLSNGKATFTFYMYNVVPTNRNNPHTTYTINYEIINNIPQLAGISSFNDEVEANKEYKINLAGVFRDVDGEELTYKYSTDGTNYTVMSGDEYTFAESISGEYKVYFKANDGLADSNDVYTVTMNVTNSKTLYTTNVKVPEDITPSFYITREFDKDGKDVLNETLTAEKGKTEDGFTQYTIQIPENISRISVRSEWGGMSFETKKEDSATLVKVSGQYIDFAGNEIEGAIDSVAYGKYKAVNGEKGYLLCAEQEYVFNAKPANTTAYASVTKTEKVLAAAEGQVVVFEVPYNNPVTITAPTGAKSQLYLYNQYYSNKEYEAYAVVDNENGTSTTYFVGAKIPTGGGSFIYRVTYEDYIVKAGWTSGNVTVNFNENDLKSNARVDYKTSTDTIADMAEDNVLLNINGQNNLVMSVGQTKTLKAYRAWEIIPISYNNWIITPDFHYNIVRGDDVVSLADKASLSTTDTDWKTIKALKSGVAIIEVSYDAINVSGSSAWNGTYGATDPARTGLMVVQVGGHANVDFGIQGKSSQGNLDYEKSTKKAWDAEFDTLYFTGTTGELELSPTAQNSTVQKVQISSDKGNSWKTLSEADGVYTAQIAHGNNIIRVITDNGEAYQVVRGYKVNVTYKIANDNGNGIVDAGETVRVIFDQIHQPIPKMGGNYNPGYGANADGDSSVHIRYTFNDTIITGGKTQYKVPTEANYIDVTIPEDTTETSFTLSDGYLAVGVIGLTTFADGGDSHRNIPDAGCGTRGTATTFHTRSMLPDITINIGDQAAPNSAPYAKGNAVKTAQIELGQTYALNPETLFADADKDPLSFTYTVNGTVQGETDKTFTFKPGTIGEYKITFVASDGKLSATHTVTLTVVAASQKDTTLKFDIVPSKIKGYVTVGFEDFGVRDEDAYGLKYPIPLGVIIPDTNVPFAEGDTIAEVTIRLLDAMGIGYEYSGSVTSGFYLAAIKDFVVNGTPYDSMAQFDAGEGSGWMITSNDWFIDKGASEFAVKAGDEIKWKYTCQLGSDIGDNSWEKVVQEVEELIAAIGSPITLDSIDKITEARKAYDELSDFYQGKVSNYNDLLAAEKTLENLVKENATEADKEAAAKVDQLIDAIGTVTLDSTQAISDAREAYEELTSLQKQLVTKLEQLETAENVLKQLSSTSHEDIYRETGEYIASLGTPSVGAIGGEWMVVGLGRGDQGITDKIANEYFANVVEYVDSKFEQNPELEKEVRLHGSKSTDNARVILGLTAVGFDATNVNGYNLFQGLDDMEYLKYQGINGPIWALIALNSHPSYKDELKNISEEDLVNEILAAQLEDGGWDLLGEAADVDMTAMAIQALATYYNTDETVKHAIDKALEKLSSMQQDDGSFASVDGKNSESTAQVIVALTALGINPEEDARFIKKGMSVVDALSNFAVEGGGFMHTPDSKLDGMATEQGYYALASYFRLLNGQTSLYDMQDVTLRIGEYLAKEDDSKTDFDSKVVEKEETVEEDVKEETKENIEEDLKEDFVESVPETEEGISAGVTEQDNSVAFIWCAIAAAGIFALIVLIVIRRRMEENK